jgi:hypothetical protein
MCKKWADQRLRSIARALQPTQLSTGDGFQTIQKPLQTSTDYTFDKGTHTFREAALPKVPEARLIDSIHPELYQRLNDVALEGETFHAQSGVAVTVSKTALKRFTLDVR